MPSVGVFSLYFTIEYNGGVHRHQKEPAFYQHRRSSMAGILFILLPVLVERAQGKALDHVMPVNNREIQGLQGVRGNKKVKDNLRKSRATSLFIASRSD